MNKSRINVLIVEDDSTHGKAMVEVFKRAGYTVKHVNSSVQGLLLAQREEFHCVVSDCMLPKMNGVDMIIEMKKLTLHPPKVFLFSGIFKDKNFVKTSMDKTGAEAFFTKPLDMKDLLKHVDDAFKDETYATDDPPLLHLYKEEVLDDVSVVQMMMTESTMHAVHLPMLYKRLMQTRLTGELTMQTETGDLNSVSMFRGGIFAVRTPDKDTYFGGLAVGFGFVSPDEVMEALREPPGKLLGQRLIDSMSLSPHAINVILGEQLALRLSQTVHGGIVALKWETKRFAEPNHVLDVNRFEALITDWMRSKIDSEWIKPFFDMWGIYRLQGHYHQNIQDADTINDLVSNPEFVPEQDYLYLFRQLLNGNATIGSRGEDTRNFNFLEHRLNQALANFKDKNYFQILGVGDRAQHLELNRAINELRQTFDPANLPSGTPPGIRVKATKVFQQIEQAYKTLSEETARTQYVMNLQTKRSSLILENEPQFRAAILELQNGQPKKAVKRLEALIAMKLEFRDLRAYYIWAGLKSDKQFRGMTLDQVPPEERHSAPYMVAKGIWHRQRGQAAKALEAFRTAHLLNPSLTAARQELETLKSEIESNGGSNRALLKEVTQVMDTLLGKSRRGA